MAHAIDARSDKMRVLGLESTSSGAVLHLALQHDVNYPYRTALEAGNEVAAQFRISTSVLSKGQYTQDIAGVKVRQCVNKDETAEQDMQGTPRRSGSYSLGESGGTWMRASSTLTNEDFEHCGSSKCTAMIQGLNRQLQDALSELQQVHKQALNTSSVEDDRMMAVYKDSVAKLQEEATLRRSVLDITKTNLEKTDQIITEHEVALQHAQSQLHQAQGRLARRDNEEQLRLSELVGQVQHLKLDQMQWQRQLAAAQEETVLAQSKLQQQQAERAQLMQRMSSLQVEVDVISKSRHDEWHQRHAHDMLRDQQLAAAQQQIEILNVRIVQLQQSHDATQQLPQQGTIPESKNEVPSKEAHRMIELERQLQEARTAEREGATEVARLKSRLDVAQAEASMLGSRLDLATGALCETASAAHAPDLPAVAAPVETWLHDTAMATHTLAAAEAAALHAKELSMAKEELSAQKKHSAQALEEAHSGAKAAAERAAHDLELAKQIGIERQAAIEDLCAERDAITMQLQHLLQAARDRDEQDAATKTQEATQTSLAAQFKCNECEGMRKDNTQLFQDNQRLHSLVKASKQASTSKPGHGGADEVQGVCEECEDMRKDNKQLFQDNQKLFRDNKTMTTDLKASSAKLDAAKQTVADLVFFHITHHRVAAAHIFWKEQRLCCTCVEIIPKALSRAF